jgi:hypothetical protein
VTLDLAWEVKTWIQDKLTGSEALTEAEKTTKALSKGAVTKTLPLDGQQGISNSSDNYSYFHVHLIHLKIKKTYQVTLQDRPNTDRAFLWPRT